MCFRISFDHFNWIAPIYDVIIPEANIEAIIRYGQFPTMGKVLDVGGGTGRVTRQLVRLQPDITIADSSFGMLRVANQKLDVKLTLCEAEEMPFPASSFERILLMDTLHHVADASQTLRECLRVLKNNGLLIIQEPDIEQWGGKIIAIFEKLLLMRSNLLSAKYVQSILTPIAKEVTLYRSFNQYWILCRK